jgi:hypothetical protein
MNKLATGQVFLANYHSTDAPHTSWHRPRLVQQTYTHRSNKGFCLTLTSSIIQKSKPTSQKRAHDSSFQARYSAGTVTSKEFTELLTLLLYIFNKNYANNLCIYEDRLRSSWTLLITPSRNFAEVQWLSPFRSTSLGKRCTSYNAPPSSRKRAADRWSLRNFLPRSSLFMVGKAQKSHGARSRLYGGCSNGVPPISVSASIATFQSGNANAPLRLLRHPKKVSFKTTETPFSRSGRGVVRSASLAKGGTSEKRPSPHLHKVPTWSNKVSPQTLQTALVHFRAVPNFTGFSYGRNNSMKWITTVWTTGIRLAARAGCFSSRTHPNQLKG